MAIDFQKLGQRLRRARENCGFSQEAAAEALQLQRTAITRMESGERAVSTVELDRLARLYRVPVQDFFREEEGAPEEDMLVALYRLAPFMDADRALKGEVARCLDICREGRSLEELLRSRKSQALPVYKLPDPASPWQAITQGNRIADEERRRLSLGVAPIADVEELVSEQGVWTARAALPDSMSGLFLHHPSVGMAVLISKNHKRWRMRFSCAHEYAHALMDRNRTVTVSTAENATELIEKRANAFAASFLMPEAGVRAFLSILDKDRSPRDVGEVFDVAGEGAIESGSRPPSPHPIMPQDVAMLAHHFGVSYQAAAFRLKSLRILPAAECAELLDCENEGKEYLRLFELLDDIEGVEPRDRRVNRELESQVAHLAIEAYRREEISSGRLREIAKRIGVPGRKLLEMAGGTLAE